MIEDLGDDALQPPPEMPRESKAIGLDGSSIQQLVSQDQQSRVQVVNSFVQSLKLKESGSWKDGDYFGYLLHTRRVTKVGPEGKRVSYSVLVVIGNGKGTAGYGMGKDLAPGGALSKAVREARKQLIHVDLFDQRTIFHPFKSDFRACKLTVTLRRMGSGTRTSWPLWKVCSCFGIQDVSTKIFGSHNVIDVTKAFFNGLQRMSTPQEVAERRGIRVLDMTPRTKAGMMGVRPETYTGIDARGRKYPDA